MVSAEAVLSRVVGFGLDNFSVGEFDAVVNRGWALAGSSSTSGGASSSFSVSDVNAEQPWLQFGRLVLIERAPLRPWVGVIDPPWTPILPVQITAYDPAYLLSLRTPDNKLIAQGDIPKIIQTALDLANAQEEMFLRLGNVNGISSQWTARGFDQTPLWGQLNKFAVESGFEMVFRPKREGGRLTIYLDLSSRFGSDINYTLFDGQQGNMRVVSASVEGPILNRVIGISNQNTSDSRLATPPYTNDESIETYRLRSWVEQGKVSSASMLEEQVRIFLANKKPRLKLAVEVKEEAFPVMDLGNRILVHASGLRLPGGRRGWMGDMRVLAMDYNEKRNVITSTMEALL